MGLFGGNKDIDETMLNALADILSDKLLSSWGLNKETAPTATQVQEETPAAQQVQEQTPAAQQVQTPAAQQNDDILKKIDALTKAVMQQSPQYQNLSGNVETFEDILHQQLYYPPTANEAVNKGGNNN